MCFACGHLLLVHNPLFRMINQAYNEALDVNYLMNKDHVIEHLQRKFEDDLKTIDTASTKEKEFLQMIMGKSKYKCIFRCNIQNNHINVYKTN